MRIPEEKLHYRPELAHRKQCIVFRFIMCEVRTQSHALTLFLYIQWREQVNENYHISMKPVRNIGSLTKQHWVASLVSVSKFFCLCGHGNSEDIRSNGNDFLSFLAVNETPTVCAYKNQETFYCSQKVSGTLDKWLLIILICSQLVEHNTDLTDYVISVSMLLEA